MIILRAKYFGLTKEEREKREKKEKEELGRRKEKSETIGAATAAGILGISGLVNGLRTNISKAGSEFKSSDITDRSKELNRLANNFNSMSSVGGGLFDNTKPIKVNDYSISSEPRYNRRKGVIDLPTGEIAAETVFHNDPKSLSLAMAKMINHNKSGDFKKEALDKYTTRTGRFLNSDNGHLITRAGRGLSLVNSIRSGLHAAKEESKGKKEGKLSKHSAWILPTLTEAMNVTRDFTNENTANKLLKDSNLEGSGRGKVNYLDSQRNSRLLKSAAVVMGNLALKKASKLIGRKIYKKQDEDSER